MSQSIFHNQNGTIRKLRLLFFTTIFLLFVHNVVFASEMDGPLSSSLTENERIIIGFHDQIDESLLEQIPHTLYHKYETIEAISVTVPAKYINQIKLNPKVAFVEKDTSVQVDETFNLATEETVNWGYEKTITPETIDLNITGKGVKIGIIDTGVDSSHPDLHIAGGKGFVSWERGYDDKNGHGTHVAGIIGAQQNGIGIIGIAPDAQIYALKALHDDGDGSLADVIAAIDWAIQQHLDIINLSLSTEQDSWIFRKMIEKAEEAGIFVVAASGNIRDDKGQTTPDILFPARYSSVISVGALEQSLKHASFSYIGPSLDFSAPGDEILSTYINESGYIYASGTSMAAPFVTGILALYKQAFPNLDRADLLEQMRKNVLDLGDIGWDAIYGYGMVTAPFTKFTDLEKNRWYVPFIHELEKGGDVKGFPDGTFQPESWITRGEVVTMIGRMLGLDEKNRETRFSDVPKDFYASGIIESAAESGIITGFPDETFRPNDYISRGDAALMIQRAFQFLPSTNGVYSDINSHTYYAEAVNALTHAGIITGYEDGTFRPNNPITRSEMAAMLARVKNDSLRVPS